MVWGEKGGWRFKIMNNEESKVFMDHLTLKTLLVSLQVLNKISNEISLPDLLVATCFGLFTCLLHFFRHRKVPAYFFASP